MKMTELVVFRCSDAERKILASVAEKHERTVSDTLRKIIRDEAKNLGLWPERPLCIEEKEVVNDKFR